MSARQRACWASVAILALLACASAPPPERTRIRVVTQPYLTLAPIHIAVAESIFTRHGLAVDLVPMNRPTDAVPLLLRGELDVLTSTVQAAFFNAAARGEPIRAVAERGYYDARGCTFMALVARPGLPLSRSGGGADGNGRGGAVKRLSYDRQAPMLYMTHKLLARAGLSLEKLTATEVPHAAEGAALRSGALDVALAGEPWLSRLLTSGSARVWTRAEEVAPNEVFGYVFFGRNLLERDRETGRRFMRAYREAVARYRQGKTARNVAILAAATGDDTTLIRRACWPSLRVDSRIDTAGLLAFQQWAERQGLVANPATIDQLWDSSFVAHADSALRSAR
ncbi:MAG: ABC transporter substrate-binding protein [Gemmatimonadaceae bacterium]